MKKLLSAFMCLSLLVGFCGPIAEAAPQRAAVTTVIACSDFQNPDGNEAGKAYVQRIIGAMGITSADGFLCCGDYDYDYWNGAPESETKAGVDALREALSGVVTENLVLGQGNHDSAIGTAGMSQSGSNDPGSGAYGVFLINEDDYMWYVADEGRVKETARNLKKYLDQKRAAQYNRPIFVISHLPLHFSMRTINNGDGQYANYIFDVLNEAGAAGLNIFFLFGHDHSNGWDDYLGGSSIYLTKGDEILIAQASRTNFEAKTLQFTYLNAGYTGYYENNNGADDTLTMTMFQISDDQVTVARYSVDGWHDLKTAGVRNSYKNENAYPPNPKQYSSPQTVQLTEVTVPVDPPAGHEGACYTRVAELSGLADGGGYVLICRPDGGGSHYFMLPKVVTKENDSGTARTGFDIESAWDVDVGGETIYGDFASKEWTFTSGSGGWLIGDGQQYAALTQTSDHGVTATLESVGTVWQVGQSGDEYTFSDGTDYLNYNTRGLINGYDDDPAMFYIYRFAGYDVEVTNGSASSTVAAPGTQVNITADAAPEGQAFDKWEVISGDVTLSEAELQSAGITITMPAGAVRLRATYRSAEHTHTYGDWTTQTEATCTQAGSRQRTCGVCGNVETDVISVLGHNYASEWTIDVPATATTAGSKSHHCTRCGDKTDITEIPATGSGPVDPPAGHEGACYTRVMNASGLKDGGKYLLVCRSDSDDTQRYLMPPKVVTKEDDSGSARTGFDAEPVTGFGGATVYGEYAGKEWIFTSASGGWLMGNGQQYAALTQTDDHGVTATLEAGGTVWQVSESSNEYTFSDGTDYLNYNRRHLINGYDSDPAVFYIYEFTGYDVEVAGGSAAPAVAAPGAQVSVTAGAAPAGQVFDKWEIVSGDVTLSAAELQSPSITITMPAGTVRLRATYRSAGHTHTYGSWTTLTNAACTQAGSRQRTCSVCGDVETGVISALGHKYSTVWTIDVPATATTEGSKSHHCTRCGDKTDITVIPAGTASVDPGVSGCSHSYGGWETVTSPSCTDAGVRCRSCTLCGKVMTGRIAALGHSYSAGWTIDVPATETTAGSQSRHCVRCGERGDVTEIPVADTWKQTLLPYRDVTQRNWYHTAVQYVVSHKLFVGISSTEFAPNMTMSRAMLATVLWRMDGKPTVSGHNPFTDIADGKYYTSPVLWAWSENIFVDIDGAEFVPAGDVTREQLATILYRYSQRKGYNTAKRASLAVFPDSGSTSAFAKEALAWAVAEGLIAGVNQNGVLLLSPQGSASRAQVATILMRYQLNAAK